MNQKNRLPIVIGVGITLLILVLVLVSLAFAQEGNEQPLLVRDRLVNPESPAGIVPGGPGYISLDSSAFRNLFATDSYAFGSWGLYNPGTAGNMNFLASVNLPHGARLTKVVAYFYDYSSAYDLKVRLYMYALDGGFGGDMAEVVSDGAVSTPRFMIDSTIDYSQIDNSSNSYILYLELPADKQVQLIAVRLDYAYPSILPLILK